MGRRKGKDKAGEYGQLLLQLLRRPGDLSGQEVIALIEAAGWLLDHASPDWLASMVERLDGRTLNRLYLALHIAAFRRSVKLEEGVGIMIPFAWPLMFMARGKRAEGLDREVWLPQEVLARFLEALRQEILGQDQEPTIVLTAPLYCSTDEGWYSPLGVRRWLGDMAACLADSQATPLLPVRRRSLPPKGIGEESLLFDVRALAGVAITSRPEDVDLALFGDPKRGVPRGRVSEGRLEALAEAATRALEEGGRRGWTARVVHSLLELFEVPMVGLNLRRSASLAAKVFDVLQMRPRPPAPVVYVSSHHSPGLSPAGIEVRVAAYPSPTCPAPLFTYVWKVVPQWESPDDVVATIEEQVARPLRARLVIEAGPQPDRRDPKTGERVFPGPLPRDWPEVQV